MQAVCSQRSSRFDYQQKCKHNHDTLCSNCDNLKDILHNIEAEILVQQSWKWRKDRRFPYISVESSCVKGTKPRPNTDWLTDRLTDWPTDRLTDWPTDWLTDWLTRIFPTHHNTKNDSFLEPFIFFVQSPFKYSKI